MTEEIQPQPQQQPTEAVVVAEDNSNKNTISSKLSTDRLICKSPKESPDSSVKILKNLNEDDSSLLLLGLLQFIFGFLMVVFGGMVLQYDASLGQLGAGIWSGCLTMSTGIVGILASARDWCPLKSTAQKITHTIFLALSLISLAVAQLVVALAATGAARDINSSEFEQEMVSQEPSGRISILLPSNYMCIVSNLGLLAVSAAEFVVAAVASYKSSRLLCPCFRRKEDDLEDLSAQRNALVSSWLGKQPNQPVYVMAPSTLGRGSKMSVQPIYAVPPSMMRYPLIPAPLGSIPSPVIPPSPRRRPKKKKLPKAAALPAKKGKKKSQKMTEEEAVKSYTGLDKAIAEEFIDICDSRHVSLCSDSSCTSSCQRSCDEVAAK